MKVCAFGDSILKGVVLDGNGKYKLLKESFSNICENTLGIKVENWGKFGSKITNGEQSLEKHYDKIKDYEYVIMEFGGNDCDFNWKEIAENKEKTHRPNSTIQEFRRKYIEIINKIREQKVEPILLSLPPINSERYFKTVTKGLNQDNILSWMNNDVEHINLWHEMYNLEIFKIAMEEKVNLIDITSKFLEMSDYKDYLCLDGIHPNEKGHMLIASIIKEYIEKRYSNDSKVGIKCLN